jgi:Spy/CpxP family protein refolding chaperone
MLTPSKRIPSPRRGALRLLAATGMLALAASLAQPALAQPQPGGMGPMGGMGEMGGMGRMGMGEMGGGPGMPMMGGRHGARVLDSIGATAEQKAQLQKIMDAARADLKPLREAGQALHRQMRTLLAQPTVDANALEALRQQLQANHDQASKRMTQAMLESSRVLSPEQRKQLAERMEQRRSMAQRHRAERESLDGGARKP